MSIFDSFLGRAPVVVTETRRVPKSHNFKLAKRALAAKRERLPTTRLTGGAITTPSKKSAFAGVPVIVPQLDAEMGWRLQDLDTKTLDRIPPSELLEYLTDLSPDVSKALWDWLRFCNPGVEIKALRVGSDTEEDEVAQKELERFLAVLRRRYGTLDALIGKLFFSTFIRGAQLGELVLDDAGRMGLHLATPDAAVCTFREVNDPKIGATWEPGTYDDAGKWVSFDRETIRYVPIDPAPGSPYGRSMAAPALFPALFLLGLMHDLRRVVAQQGYPRLDITVDLEVLQEMMPQNAMEDPDAFQAWSDKLTEQVKAVFTALEPDSTYVHSSVIKVNRPVGTVDSSSLGAVDGLIRSIERMLTRALKTMPLLMGSNEGSTETHANRQWEVMLAGIRAVQHATETMLGDLFTLFLRAQGKQNLVNVHFAELRASEELRDAQVRAMQISNAVQEWMMGWIDSKEASNRITGHDPVSEEPLYLPTTVAEPGAETAAQLAQENPTPGENRSRGFKLLQWKRNQKRDDEGGTITPLGADAPLPDVPDDVTFTAAEIDLILGDWDYRMPEWKELLDARVKDA